LHAIYCLILEFILNSYFHNISDVFIFIQLFAFLFQFLSDIGNTDEGIMIERIGIGADLGLDPVPGQGVDLSIDQGHVLVHALRGKFWKDQ